MQWTLKFLIVQATKFLHSPGIFFILPCIETYSKVDLRTSVFDVPPQEASGGYLPDTPVYGHLDEAASTTRVLLLHALKLKHFS